MFNGRSDVGLFQMYRRGGGGGVVVGVYEQRRSAPRYILNKNAADYSNYSITTSLQEIGDILAIFTRSFINQAFCVQNCR